MAKKKSAKKSASKPAKKTAVKSKPKVAAKKPAKKSAPKAKASAQKPKTPAKKTAAKTATQKTATKSPATTAMKSMPKPAKASARKSINLAAIFTPLDDRVVVEQAAVVERTAGGLYLPDNSESMDHYKEGRVAAVGRGHFNKKGFLRPIDVKVGDQVIFVSYAGREIQIQDQTFLVITEADILGIRD